MRPSIIAIDGPAASGKSTIGNHLAQYLSYLYLDTGVLYRAVTWAALHQAIPVHNEAAIAKLAQTLIIDVVPPTKDDGRQYTVRVGDTDVTWEIRTPEVDGAVSPVSAYPEVRRALTQRMREIAHEGHVVMVGRDIGTVVLPNADLKLYVVASSEERATRRFQDMKEQGKQVSYNDVLSNIQERDRIDSTREAAPLRPAKDAILLDTTELSIKTMFREVEKLVDNHIPESQSNN